MKAQCERCKEIVPLQFSVEAAAIRVRCPACRAEYAVAATETSEPAAPPPPSPSPSPSPSPTEMTCPKCGDVQKKSDACRRCGLIIARWKPDAVAADPALGDAREAAALWETVENNWDDGERHEAFIAHCRRTGVLAFAAARYRQAQAAARPRAGDRLTQIRVVAEQSLAAVRRDAPPKRSNLRTVLLAAVVAILLVMIWVLVSSAFDTPGH